MSADPFIAEISMFAGTFAPRGWAFCDGQILPISQNTALFSLIGTIYGGDGRTTFALPDLRGRVPVGPRTGPGLSDYSLGARGGSEDNTIAVNNMPAHTHTVSLGAKEEGNTDDPNGAFVAGNGMTSFGTTSDITLASATTDSEGAGQPVNNRQPYLAINFIIALQGIFPSRN
jgi:microcystin-dependent protein